MGWLTLYNLPERCTTLSGIAIGIITNYDRFGDQHVSKHGGLVKRTGPKIQLWIRLKSYAYSNMALMFSLLVFKYL